MAPLLNFGEIWRIFYLFLRLADSHWAGMFVFVWVATFGKIEMFHLLLIIIINMKSQYLNTLNCMQTINSHVYGGARSLTVIVVGIERDDCISHSTNTLGKGMNPIILPPAMGK